MEIIEKQHAISQELQQAIKNYKKTPTDRKTLSYVQQKLANMQGLWDRFNATDNLIRRDSSIPETHEYYTSELFEKIRMLFDATRTSIEQEVMALKPVLQETAAGNNSNPSTSKNAGNNASKLPLKIQKGIASVKQLILKAQEDPDSAHLSAMKLNTIEHHWKMVQKLHEQLWATANDDYDLDEFLHHESIINEGVCNLSKRLSVSFSTGNNSTVHGETVSERVTLPKIELPVFDGSFTKWRPFKDLFTEMVHKQQLSGCQKLWYLKSSLTGEASRLIQHLSTTSENYMPAWEIIQNRYENKRLIVATTLQRLLSQQSIQRDSAVSIKTLHDQSSECLFGLKAMGLNISTWDPILVHILSQLLDRHTQLLWEQSLTDPRELPSVQDFMKFLELRFQSLEAVGPSKRSVQSSSNSLMATIDLCVACNQSHMLFACPKFKGMKPAQRLQLAQNAKCCVNCLKSNHTAKQCPSSRNCHRCNKRHNTLLHLDTKPINEDHNKPSSSTTQSTNRVKSTQSASTSAAISTSSLFATSSYEKASVLLSTIVLLVDNAFGHQVECRAILDSGSQVHLITQKFADKLGLPQTKHHLRIQGVGEAQHNASNRVILQVASRITSFNTTLEALVLPTIVTQQPRQYINTNNWKIPKNIKLGDPQFNVPGDVDMLIGAGLFYSILSIGQINLGRGLPILQNTLLGWLVGGTHIANSTNDCNSVCGICTEDEELFTSMEKFWELEECPSASRQMTTAELRCEEHFQNTHSRTSDQRFVVKLPLQGDITSLGESYGIALQRLKSVEKRLSKDNVLHQEYIKFLHEYERLGHMQEVSKSQIKGPHYFMPHHAVLKPDSTTTKVRVVFDASAKTSTNISLNDILAVGPTIQDDVFTQLLRFRFPKYVFTADIEKMYRQIWVDNNDRFLQLILWRENPHQPIKIYQLNTVTYGTSCAPFLAVRSLRQLAIEGATKYPLAADIINKNFYVDDVLTGADDIKTAVDQLHELRKLLSTAGLNLRKWCSNDPRILKHIPEKDREVSLEINKSEVVKTMGLIWTPREDCFSIRTEININTKVTKRRALADISKVFDPLGFMAPVTITAKIFLQDLWKLKLDWDAALPQELDTKWMSFRREFHHLDQIKISRHTFGSEEPKIMQIHIFADASEKAYGAVAYVRSITRTNLVIVRLLCAKSKVAPTKQTTLPRLELCAAKLASDLMKRIQQDLNIERSCFYLWSDSTAVLGWINAQSSNYHTFVANRIAAIQRVSSVNQWQYVESKSNPADMLSRGLNPSQLVNNNFWFFGPKMLHGNSDPWADHKLQVQCSLELRQNARVTVAICPIAGDVIADIEHKNSFRRLQRIVAYMLRCAKPKLPGAELLTKANLVLRPIELQEALRCITKYLQSVEFQHHIHDIKKYGAVQHTSSLSHLSPFIDDQGLLRVGGRLQSSDLSYDAKHPVLLSHKHPLTKLLLADIHRENMHCGVQTLLAISRQNFWIINGKTLARHIIHNCVQCVRYKPKLAQQVMGPLPKDRVTAARPFYITGVDFCGPVYIHFKIRGKRPTKAYIAVFCCFTTKAVHLELVSDLTTEAFIGALKRFTGRRGRCQKLYCDNATNFKGTSNALSEISTMIHAEQATADILKECNKIGIEFCFIPPRAPHFGGLWEAAVKSAKGLLKSTLASASLTYEEMETVIIDAEAILNSRPLTPMSSDPNDMSALTPGHFLIGEPLTTIADAKTPMKNVSCLTRWNLVKHLKVEFWRRWYLEYLNGLQHRYKWNKECPDIKNGTMVIIKDENLPPQKWPLGRIERVIHGEDGHVRVVDVRTANNVSRRPIHKLAPLPVEHELMDLPGTTRSTTESQPPTKGRKRKSITSVTALLLTCLILPITSGAITFTTFKNEPLVYFERIGMANMVSNTWNLVNYVDLTPFHQEAKLAHSYHNTLQNLCKLMALSSTCNETIRQYQHKVTMIDTNNQLLMHRNRAKRGAFNMIGNIAGALFGVLDSDYADKLAETIDNLKANDESLKIYAEKQTMVLDRTLNVMKRNTEQINDELQALDKVTQEHKYQISKITQEVYQTQLLSTFSSTALRAVMHATRFQSVQDEIIDILTNSHHGRVSPELLPQKEFQEQLQNINSHISRATKIPFAIDDMTQYYQIMAINHQVTDKYIIFTIRIPLVSTYQFELLKLTAIPWSKNETLLNLKLNTEYLMVDLLRESFFPISEFELQGCMITDNNIYLCRQSQPTHNKNSTECLCEMTILRTSRIHSECRTIIYEGRDYWKQLHTPNTWLVATRSTQMINTVCDNEPQQIEISRSGVLRIGNTCTVKTPTITIVGHEEINRTRVIVYVPGCNTSQISIQPEETIEWSTRVPFNLTSHIESLQRELHNIQTISLNKIRPHDVHHYSLGYVALFLIICCAICIILLYCYQKRIVKNFPPRPAPRTLPSPISKPVDTESNIITMYDS